MRRNEAGRIAVFGGVGVLATVTDFATYALCIGLSAHAVAANAAAFVVANIQAYLMNARITFRDRATARLSLAGYGRYMGVHLVGLALSTAVVWALAHRVGPFPAKILAIGAAAASNYLFASRLVFRDR